MSSSKGVAVLGEWCRQDCGLALLVGHYCHSVFLYLFVCCFWSGIPQSWGCMRALGSRPNILRLLDSPPISLPCTAPRKPCSMALRHSDSETQSGQGGSPATSLMGGLWLNFSLPIYTTRMAVVAEVSLVHEMFFNSAHLMKQKLVHTMNDSRNKWEDPLQMEMCFGHNEGWLLW